jgi:hypothetical protein
VRRTDSTLPPLTLALRPLRWLLALASPGLGCLLAVVGSVFGALADPYLCPPELLLSGLCTAKWFPYVQLAMVATFVALGATIFVVLPVALAPSHKHWIALVAYAVGAILVTVVAWQVGPSFWPPYAAALAAGGITAAIAYSRHNAG